MNSSVMGHGHGARGLSAVTAFAGLVRFVHTVFALPFALAGALFVGMRNPGWGTLGWILLAMAGARSLAMALNRLVDAEIDARNPRTAGRELPAGRLTRRQVHAFSAASLVALLLAVSQLARPTWYLWVVPVALFVAYPYAKRVTWLCHAVLGITIGIAPVGAWVAVTGAVAWTPVLLGLGVAAWIAGFDVTYALLDLEFDRANGVQSFPARFGSTMALSTTRVLHAAAIALLAAAGWTAGAGWPYAAGMALCAAVLIVENIMVDPARPDRVNAAFNQANLLLSVIFAAAVVAEVMFR
jgi:4-hydroxybenzoate polyprenyltransferase